MTVRLILLALFALQGVFCAWYQQIDPPLLINDEESLQQVVVNATSDELDYLALTAEHEALLDQLNLTHDVGGLYLVSAVDGSRKRTVYTKQLEIDCHLITNSERAKEGVGPLYANSILIAVSRAHSKDMGVNGYFSHTSQDGRSPFDRMNDGGYRFTTAAENIAAGSATAAGTLNQWMNSAGHKRNILNGALREMGCTVENTAGSRYRYYWTQVFGTPRRACGNGFKESGEECDTGGVPSSGCSNACQLTSGSCNDRDPLDAGQVCGTALPTTTTTTTKATTTRKPTTTTTKATTTKKPTTTTTKPGDTPTVTTTTKATTTKATTEFTTEPGFTVSDDDLRDCNFKDCHSCTILGESAGCKWCPNVLSLGCMTPREFCGGSIKESAKCDTGDGIVCSNLNGGLVTCQQCAAEPNCEWCPSRRKCGDVSENCRGGLPTVDACDQAQRINQVDRDGLYGDVLIDPRLNDDTGPIRTTVEGATTAASDGGTSASSHASQTLLSSAAVVLSIFVLTLI